MNKDYAYLLIAFFVFCVGIITYLAAKSKYLNRLASYLSYFFILCMWVGIIAMILITIKYEQL